MENVLWLAEIMSDANARLKGGEKDIVFYF